MTKQELKEYKNKTGYNWTGLIDTIQAKIMLLAREPKKNKIWAAGKMRSAKELQRILVQADKLAY